MEPRWSSWTVYGSWESTLVKKKLINVCISSGKSRRQNSQAKVFWTFTATESILTGNRKKRDREALQQVARTAQNIYWASVTSLTWGICSQVTLVVALAQEVEPGRPLIGRSVFWSPPSSSYVPEFPKARYWIPNCITASAIIIRTHVRECIRWSVDWTNST